MYREFRIQTIEENRDGYKTRVQLRIDGDNYVGLLKQARAFAKEKGIARIPVFEAIAPEYGYRGTAFVALNKAKTGVIITEVFA